MAMASGHLKRQYWDSVMFLSMLTGTQPERVSVIGELLAPHEKGTIEIIISTMTIAETRPYQANSAYTVEQEAKITELFDSDALVIYAVTPQIAQTAREIGASFHYLTPTDCIHIATAITAKADVLFTYDGAGARRRPRHMLAHSGEIGTPPLRISQPFVDYGPLYDPAV